MKAIRQITDIARPLVAVVERSAAEPAATATGGLPNKPAQNLKTIKPPKLFVAPQPATNAAYNGVQVKKTKCLPRVSLKGAFRTGPKERPIRSAGSRYPETTS
jgi:hypothetical protein